MKRTQWVWALVGIAAAIVWLVSSSPVQAGAKAQVAPAPQEVAFVDFNGGSFEVPKGGGSVQVPLTSNLWSIVENKSSLLSFAEDRIYVLQPGVRVAISGEIEFSRGSQTFFQIGMSAQDSDGQTLYDMNRGTIAVFKPVLGMSIGSFALQGSRSFTADDFQNGNPYIVLSVREDAHSPLGCMVHLRIEVN